MGATPVPKPIIVENPILRKKIGDFAYYLERFITDHWFELLEVPDIKDVLPCFNLNNAEEDAVFKLTVFAFCVNLRKKYSVCKDLYEMFQGYTVQPVIDARAGIEMGIVEGEGVKKVFSVFRVGRKAVSETVNRTKKMQKALHWAKKKFIEIMERCQGNRRV